MSVASNMLVAGTGAFQGQLWAAGTVTSFSAAPATTLGSYQGVPAIFGSASGAISTLKLLSTSLTTARANGTVVNTLDDGSGNAIVAGNKLTWGNPTLLVSSSFTPTSSANSNGAIASFFAPNATYAGSAPGIAVGLGATTNNAVQLNFNYASSTNTVSMGPIASTAVPFGSLSTYAVAQPSLFWQNGALYSAKSTLDDGNGNATFSGKLTLTSTGNSLLVGATSGTNSNIQVQSQNSAWQLIANGSSSASPSASNTFSFYNNASSNNPFAVNQLGKVYTPNNILDDGSGNASISGTNASYGSPVFQAMVPTLQTSPTNYGVSAFVGKSATVGQCANLTFGYNYTGSGTGTASSTNSLSLGIYGGKALNINGVGKVYTTGGNILDDGAGNATVATALTITGNTLVNSSGNSITLPSTAGTLVVNGQSSLSVGSFSATSVSSSSISTSGQLTAGGGLYCANTSLPTNSTQTVLTMGYGGAGNYNYGQMLFNYNYQSAGNSIQFTVPSNGASSVGSVLTLNGYGNAVVWNNLTANSLTAQSNLTVNSTTLSGSGNTLNVNLPSTSGTLALTSQIPTQYQAWGSISGTGSGCTISLVGSQGGFTASTTALSFPAGPAQWLIHWSYTAAVPASSVATCSLVLGSQTANNSSITANGSNVSTSAANITVTGQAILTSPSTMGFSTSGFTSSTVGASFWVKGLPN